MGAAAPKECSLHAGHPWKPRRASGGIGGAGEGWGTRSKCLCVIKAVVSSWKGES